MKNKSLVRDFLVYTITAIQKLLLKGQVVFFFKDISVFRLWWKFRNTTKSTLNFRTPWLVFGAIDFLDNWLTKEMIVFEYGSGGSSLFISDRVKVIYSIDHDEQWFENVKTAIDKEGIKNIEYKLYRPVAEIKGSEKNCSDPENYLSCMGEYKDLNFENYVRSIDVFPENYFDLVIIDGRARPSCILHAMRKVKPNGILLVDNADRGYYLRSFPELYEEDKWTIKKFTGHFPYCSASILGTTTLFTKRGHYPI
jgi:hypothetical protein